MRVNGEEVCLGKSLPLAAYLAARGFDCCFVAVERNGQIVPKADYEKVELQEEDILEIVRFVGGG
jgi:sulfur carrier protein